MADDDGTPIPGGGWVPAPDPTVLTNVAVEHAKEDLRRDLNVTRELLETAIAAIDAKMDATWKLHQADLSRSQDSVASLREVIFDKFSERDLRFHEKDEARQLAVETALAAARELVDTKSQAAQAAADKFQEAVIRQLETMASLNAEGRERLGDQVRALEQRLDRGEGTEQGVSTAQLLQVREHEHDSRITANRLLAMGVALSLVVILVNVIVFVLSHH
jgi:hypothetical protein